MQQVAEGTYRLGSKGHNFYLLEADKEITVVDAGCSREWNQLTGALDELGLALDAVAGMVITHVHSDHMGLGRRAQDEGIKVSVHRDDEPRAIGTYQGRFAAKATDLPLFSLKTWKNMLPMLRAGVMKLEHLEVVDTFSSGDVLDLPGRPRVVHTPGHTEGHTVFHSEVSGALFTGDALVTMDLLGSARGPQLMSEVFSVDPVQARASLSAISGLDASILLPGHGEPWSGSPGEAVRLAEGG